MEAITNYFYGNNRNQDIRRVGMNKIGTAHVLLSDSIHTLPIEEENDGGNESQFIVHDGGSSALGVGFREADPRPWKTMPGKRLRVRR